MPCALCAVALALPLHSAAATFAAGSTEVVVAPDAPKTVLFAAEEMTNLLSQVFGKPVPVATAPSENRSHIHLGDSQWTRAAGIDTASMPRDAFAIACHGGDAFIAGRDDPEADTHEAVHSPKAGIWAMLHEHATLFGVYEFLERFAGVRLFFPGELGTVTPRLAAIDAPEGRIDVTPDFIARNYSSFEDGLWFEGDGRDAVKHPMKKLNYLRNRMQTEYIPCCHGTGQFGIQRRFAADHPEYMALFSKGGRLVRDTDPAEAAHHPGQLCHSSAVYDEIFSDILSYARGDGPEVRGIGSRWPPMAFRRPWVDVMPQDGYVECMCDRCQAAYNKAERHYATELVWGRTVELARRLEAAGCPIRITQMAYPPYRRVPDIEIPGNVDVMVAELGPWCVTDPGEMKRELDEIAAWRRKLGRPVWIWTYPNKFGNRFVPDVPNGTPRAWAAYVKAAAPDIFGIFTECENDRFLYNSLCYYVLGRLCWDNGADVEAILGEYFALMFGAAAAPMSALFDDIERKWLNDVRGNMVDTPLGPERQIPGEYAIFAEIYSRELLARWRGWLDQAASLVPPGSIEARRVALFRAEFYAPLARRVEAYAESTSVAGELARRASSAATNLLVNGDFSAPAAASQPRHFGFFDDPARGSGWRGGWICPADEAQFISISNDAPEGSHGMALKMSATGQPRTVRIENDFIKASGRFKPGREYRVSFFVRLSDVVSHGNGGGVGVRVWHDKNLWFPKNRLTGTTDWIHQEFRFTAGEKSADYQSQFMLYLWNATGQVEFADLRIEPCE